MKTAKRWFRRILTGFLGLLVVFFLAIFAYSRIKDGWILAHLPQGSTLVDIGQRKIHVRAMGLEHDGPAVVLIPGFLGNSAAWSIIQPELAKTRRVYAFDPAGFGWSDPSPKPLTPSQMADDLNATLIQLKEKEIVLVGFSGGGLTVYNYYHRYPENPRVVGLVWVEGDAMIPEELSWYNGEFPIPIPESLRAPMVETGLWRVLADAMVAQEGSRIPEAVKPSVDWDYLESSLATGGTRQTAYAAFGMVAAFPNDVKYTASLPPTADIPVFALQADYAPDIEAAADSQGVEEIHQFQAKRAGWFQAFVAHSAHGQYILVKDSSHMVVYEQPQAVITAINDILVLIGK